MNATDYGDAIPVNRISIRYVISRVLSPPALIRYDLLFSASLSLPAPPFFPRFPPSAESSNRFLNSRLMRSNLFRWIISPRRRSLLATCYFASTRREVKSSVLLCVAKNKTKNIALLLSNFLIQNRFLRKLLLYLDVDR